MRVLRKKKILKKYIVYVARELAKHMNLEEKELVQHARENTERIFCLQGK